MHIKKERSSSPEIVQHVVARRSAPRRAYVGVSKVRCVSVVLPPTSVNPPSAMPTRPSYAEIAGTSRRRVSPTAVQGPMSDADESSVDVVDSPGRAVNAAFLKRFAVIACYWHFRFLTEYPCLVFPSQNLYKLLLAEKLSQWSRRLQKREQKKFKSPISLLNLRNSVIPTRGARVPGAGSGTGMKTRASNGMWVVVGLLLVSC